MKKALLLLLALVLAISACTYDIPVYNGTGQLSGSVIANGSRPIEDNTSAVEDVPAATGTDIGEDVQADVTQDAQETVVEMINGTADLLESDAEVIATEGDLIDLKTYVLDPDGDYVELTFSEPFDKKGVWQTEVGDAGFYSVIITATDNKNSLVTKQMSVKVLIKNKVPVFGISDMVEFDEGDFINLDPKVDDADGDEIIVTYSGWMGQRTYQTSYDDAGSHLVMLRADDGVVRVYRNVTVIIHNVNRAPELSLSLSVANAVEGDDVRISAVTSDADNDVIIVEYPYPFSDAGIWNSKLGDAGTHDFEVKATDGANTINKTISIVLEKRNHAPVITSFTIEPQAVELKKPGDSVKISVKVEAYDPDGDKLSYTYSGYMTENAKTVEYGMKGGEKSVKVVVSDGKLSDEKELTFSMNNWPCFDCRV